MRRFITLMGFRINDEVKLQQGVDIKMEFIKAECGINTVLNAQVSKKHPIVGRLLIPPKEGKLISIPDTCDFDGVINYQARGIQGKHYKKMTMSNDEIANFLIISSNESEIHEKISQLSSWFEEKVIWQS